MKRQDDILKTAQLYARSRFLKRTKPKTSHRDYEACEPDKILLKQGTTIDSNIILRISQRTRSVRTNIPKKRYGQHQDLNENTVLKVEFKLEKPLKLPKLQFRTLGRHQDVQDSVGEKDRNTKSLVNSLEYRGMEDRN